jgi:diguanylate cyclase (GGDEF)-like protein
MRPRLVDVFDTLTYRERYHVLLEQTDRDGLTGLYNRGRFERVMPDHTRNALANRTEVSLILVDIDDFKMINDGRGHSCGDDVLRFVGNKLLETMRTSDSVFRYGGDEFIAVVEGLGPAAAMNVAERLRQAVESGSAREGVPITVSAGVASLPVDATTVAGLFAAADSRLYSAKSHGRNRVIGTGDDTQLKSDSVRVGG